MNLTEELAEIPLFESLPHAEREKLAGIVQDRRVTRGTCIFTEGEEAEGFYVVAEGRVKVFKVSPDGKEQTLHLFGPFQPVGEAAVFAGQSFPANAECIEDGRLLFFPRDRFVALIEAYPTVALSMLAVMSKRLKRFAALIEDLSLKEAPARLAAYLLHLARQQGGAGAVELDMSKRQLASVLGSTPETLSRVLAKLTKEGLIEQHGKGHISLLDPDALARLSSDDPTKT